MFSNNKFANNVKVLIASTYVSWAEDCNINLSKTAFIDSRAVFSCYIEETLMLRAFQLDLNFIRHTITGTLMQNARLLHA